MTLLAGSIFDGTANVNNLAAVGTRFSDWVEYGFLYADEESTVSLPIGATVKAEQ